MPISFAKTATRRTALDRCSAQRPPLRRSLAWTNGRCATASRSRRNRLPASHAGCATKTTSRRRSTSAACRLATAWPRPRWSPTASLAKGAHDERRMRDRRVLGLRKRIELGGDDALTQAMPSRQGIVEVVLRHGTTLRHHMKAVRGTAENPMTRAEVDAKAYDLIAPVFGRSRARRLCDAVWNLDKLGNVRKLRPLLRRSE